MGRQEKFILASENLKIWTETYGEAENTACLFINGAGANSSSWSDNLCNTLVKKGFYVIKYDHHDFGYSDKLDFKSNPMM